MGAGGSDVERWRRVRALVQRAVLLPAAERAAFLERAGASEPELAEEARALLTLDESPHAFDSVAPSTSALGALMQPEAPATPRRAGPWELRRVLGSGGMGVVHLGVRVDGSFHQSVAVKLLHAGADGAGLHERFRRERQVLANLRHPGIARLIDGGLTDEGVPYLAMEYVEGLPIDRHCDQQRASLRERVQLFARVCEAVHEAHKSLVVHRDLKPGNILVTPQGEPKLLDFGIAKVLDPEKSSAGTDLTGAFLGLMTPVYASPEQLAGMPITTASDVYSLGVILYKLLTGHLPFGMEARSPLEHSRLANEVDPERPSAAVTRVAELPAAERTTTTTQITPALVSALRHTTPRSLKRALSGDLDRIVLKALRKEPSRRYASAEQLGADLVRYLEGRPVLARPDSTLYRASKFVGRNRGAVAAAAVALSALAGGLVASLAQYRRADALARSEKTARELGAARLVEVEQLAGELGEQKRVAEERLAELASANAELARQEELARARVEEISDLASTLVIDMNREYAALPGGTTATEHFLRTGLDHLERILVEFPDDPELLRECAAGYIRLAMIQGNSSGPNLGRLEQSYASCERAVELASAAFELASEHTGVVYNLATAFCLRGTALENLGRPQEALDSFTEALAVCELLDVERRNFGMHYTEHSVHLNLAQLLVRLGHAEDAVAHLERSVELLPSIDVGSVSIPYERGQQAVARALLEEARDDLPAAIAAAGAAVEHFAESLGPDPIHAFHLRAHSMARVQLASLLLRGGEPERARELLVELERELDARIAADPGDRQACLDLDQALFLQADAHAAVDQLEGARAACERRVALATAQSAREPAGAAWRARSSQALSALAERERELGVLLESAEHAQAALRGARELVERDPRNAEGRRASFAAHTALGRVYVAMAASQAEREPRAAHLERAASWFRLALEDQAELERLGAATTPDRSRAREIEGELGACEQARADEGG